jgi:hypothetical protein
MDDAPMLSTGAAKSCLRRPFGLDALSTLLSPAALVAFGLLGIQTLCNSICYNTSLT